MRIKISSINSILLFSAIFLSFFGFYAILLLTINFGMSGYTRSITVPARVVIVVLLSFLILINFKEIRFDKLIKIFLLFSFVYIGRVIADYFNREIYFLPTFEVLFYFMAFAIIPFLSLGTFRLNERYLIIIFDSLFISGLCFSVLAFFFYNDFLGKVGRLSSSIVGEEVISPLALSYNASVIIGVVIFYFLFNKATTLKKLFGFITLALSIAPFFLGASRGALIALFVPFIFMLFSRVNLKTFVQVNVLLVVLTFIILYLSENLGGGLLQRFLNISSDIDQGSHSAIRLVMWNSSFLQFQLNPIFGDKLGVEGFDGYYPHNIILEVLQSTGVLGFLPFSFLLYFAFSTCLTVFKNHPKYSWIAVIFIQAFIRSMFSGAVYNAVWFWTSMALLFSLDIFVRKYGKFKKQMTVR